MLASSFFFFLKACRKYWILGSFQITLTSNLVHLCVRAQVAVYILVMFILQVSILYEQL